MKWERDYALDTRLGCGRIGGCSNPLEKETIHARPERSLKPSRNIICTPMGNEPTRQDSLSLPSVRSNELISRRIRNPAYHFSRARKYRHVTTTDCMAGCSANVHRLWSCHFIQCSGDGLVPNNTTYSPTITEGVDRWQSKWIIQEVFLNSSQVSHIHTRCVQ